MNQDVFINGDGETSRDFCFVENAIQANILSATANNIEGSHIYNVALGDRTSLIELFTCIKNSLNTNGIKYEKKPIHRDYRPGDVRHSQADISKASHFIGYAPEYKIEHGIDKAMPWYIDYLKTK